jgi:hypothetical protein
MGNPVIAIDNVLEDETISASTEATGFEKENAFDGLLFDFWKPTSVPAWLKATGRMPVGMWLGDTTEESLVGSELVTNGDFATDISGWTAVAPSTAVWNAGVLDGVRNTETVATFPLTIVAGVRYIISWELVASSDTSNGYVYFRVGGVDTPFLAEYRTLGVKQYTFVAVSGDDGSLKAGGVGGLIRLAETDLSANNNCLFVHGTINKTDVGDSGLVGYCGFSGSGDYLEQPYNADLDFGTGDFHFMGWVKGNTAGYIFERGQLGATSPVIGLRWNGLANIKDGTYNAATSAGTLETKTEWSFVCMIWRSKTLEVWQDGVLRASDTEASMGSLDDVGAVFRPGHRTVNDTTPFPGSLCLKRMEVGAPTAAEILATYNKEKHYFKTGGTLPETLISTAATTADYFAMYGHDFAGSGSSVVLQYSDNNSTWVDAFDPIYPATSAPMFKTFTQSSHKYWRTYVTGAVQQIGVVMFGVATEIERGLAIGFEPFALGSENMLINSESTNGAFLGRSTKKAPIKARLSFDNIHEQWMRQYWPDLLEGLETKPFMTLPQPDTYGGEAAFCWTDGKIRTPSYTAHNHMAFTVPVKARVT